MAPRIVWGMRKKRMKAYQWPYVPRMMWRKFACRSQPDLSEEDEEKEEEEEGSRGEIVYSTWGPHPDLYRCIWSGTLTRG